MYKPIPQDIAEYLSYDSETGDCVWIKAPYRRARVGDVAGCVGKNGYRSISFRNKCFYQHRIAWFIHYGEDPGNRTVDHINGVRNDNRICNLRLVTHQENTHNRKPLGISFVQSTGKWKAQITVDAKQKFLGSFPCPLLAGIAYQDAKKIHHPTAPR